LTETSAPAPAGRTVLLTFVPLAAMWMMMAFEQPLTNAVISRLPDATRNLAAFGVAFGLCIFVQGPAVQLLVAGTALSGSRASYRRLLTFVNRLVAGLTVLQVVVGATPLFPLLAGSLMGVPGDLVPPARIAFLLMSPWHASVGYRRLWQGVLIRHGKPGLVAVTTLLRLVVVIVTSGLALAFTSLPGASVAAVAVASGMIASAIITRVLASDVLRNMPAVVEGEQPLGRYGLARFYTPLVLTSLITVLYRPLVTAALSRAPMPLESLAAWPVVSSWLFFLQGPALAVQETTVALYGVPAGRVLPRFAVTLGLALLAVTGLLSLPGPSLFCFHVLFGLPYELARISVVPFAIMGPTVALSTAIAFARGVLVQGRATRAIPIAVALNVTVLGLGLFAAPHLVPAAGVVGAALAALLSVVAEALFLTVRGRAARPATT
jgi:progressive ankylosis protein